MLATQKALIAHLSLYEWYKLKALDNIARVNLPSHEVPMMSMKIA